MDDASAHTTPLLNGEIGQTVSPPVLLTRLVLRGAGEAGTPGSAQCVLNAVIDALSLMSIRHMQMIPKAVRVWIVLQAHAK
jgi:hypothetical protein